ncbi:MAG: TonB-dependent receptor [Gemmatimonadota bacterium]|jgi:hypothetical protein
MRTSLVVGASVLALLFGAVVGAAQEEGGDPRVAGIHGRVLDARSGGPVADATVSLESNPAGLVPDRAAGAGAFLGTAVRVTTDDLGRYRFRALDRGTYRLRVVRIGYRPATLDIRYDGPADPSVSVALEVEPVRLEPLEVVTTLPATRVGFVPRRGRESGSRRVDAERLRQERFLSTDARQLTREDLVEAATLGETDLLRALRRLPGVNAAHDWSAEPWTRGARWDETLVYYDGLPLYGALHGGGLFTAVSPDLVGGVTFHPGVRPPGAGEASAGVVELTSRSAHGPPELTATAQASLLSARLSVDRPLGGGSGLTFSGRRTYVDALTRNEPLAEDRIPHRFGDLGGRWDQELGSGVRLELAGLHTSDRVAGDLPHELKGTRARWGNDLLRGTLELRRWGLRMRLTEGSADFDAEVERAPVDPDRSDLTDASSGSPTRNRIESDATSFSVMPLSAGGGLPGWEAGIRVGRTGVDYDGPAPWPFPGSADGGALELRREADLTTLWGRLRRAVGHDLEISTGLRLESRSGPDGEDGSLRLSPRLAARWSPLPALQFGAAVGRHVQYEQAVAAAGFIVGPDLVPTHLWLPSGSGVPALRSDVVTVGAEMWLSDGWLATVNAFGRWSAGHLTPAPDGGFVRAGPPVVGSTVAPGWTVARGSALGLEIGARRLAGRWTGSLAYSLVRSRREAAGVTWRPAGDRTHAVDATLLVRATPSLRIGATFTATSRAPMTRFFSFGCPDDPYCPEGAGDGSPEDVAAPVIGFAEGAGGLEGPAYVSLDLHLEKTGHVVGLPFGFFAQIRNVLDRDNPSAYLGSYLPCSPDETCVPRDRFEGGMPRVPLIGFWIRL